MFPVSEADFLVRKILYFGVTAAIKQQWCLADPKNPTMVCSYRSSCLDLPVTVVDFQVEGCPSILKHIYQGGYVAMNEIDLDGGERKIFCDCVDGIRGQVKSETLKKVGDSTMYGTDGSEEDEEEVEGTVLGGGGEYVSVMPIFYPRGMVSVSSLSYFSSIGSSSKPSHPYLPISLGVHRIQEYFKKKRGRK